MTESVKSRCQSSGIINGEEIWTNLGGMCNIYVMTSLHFLRGGGRLTNQISLFSEIY